jgi:hypothetical protein
MWDKKALQDYITNGTQEDLHLEYKAAGALANTDDKKDEITKDVSAMANSAGGTIIYGVKEYGARDKKHLPEQITPIDRMQFPKEWLEQIINNIQPRIVGIRIYPIDLGGSDTAYAVEIPQSTTVHQARDFRYYRRYNFQVLRMYDHEVRDVMNRAIKPDAAVEFKYISSTVEASKHEYTLRIEVENLGTQMINFFQLEFTFPQQIGCTRNLISHRDHIDWRSVQSGDYLIIYRSKMALFPNEKRNIGDDIVWCYQITGEKYVILEGLEYNGNQATIEWVLYADSMVPKRGSIPFSKLHKF